MPFSDTRGAIADCPQHFCNRYFIRMKSLLAVGKQYRIHIEPLVVRAGQQRGARSGANRTANIKIGKPHAVARHFIEMRCPGTTRTVEAYIAISHIIDENQNDIGRFTRWRIDVAGVPAKG